MPKVLIIDYGMSNLASITRAVELCGAEVVVTSESSQASQVDKIILPGVGSFALGMKNLRELGWDKKLRDLAKDEHRELLGVCLGMQLLASVGREGETTEGLGLIPGKVIKLSAKNAADRIPHVGWNNVLFTKQDVLFEGVQTGTDYYFVHSYQFVPDQAGSVIGTTPHCGSFVSAVRQNNICGTQFHPEKSSDYGLKLLANFINS